MGCSQGRRDEGSAHFAECEEPDRDFDDHGRIDDHFENVESETRTMFTRRTQEHCRQSRMYILSVLSASRTAEREKEKCTDDRSAIPR